MKYEKDAIEKVKDKGVFTDNFDPQVLALNDKEKQKMAKNLSKASQEMNVHSLKQGSASVEKKRAVEEVHVYLNLFEKIIAFFLSVLGIKSTDEYKMDKAIRDIEKKLNNIKPQFFSSSNRRITRNFAFRIHELNLKMVRWRKVFEKTLEDPNNWDDPKKNKTVIETLFERLVQINSAEIENNFSSEGIQKAVSGIEDVKKAVDMLDKSLYTLVYGIQKDVVEQINRAYTNLVYIRNLAFFDYNSLLKRFDAGYDAAMSPNFTDIPGDALVNYIKELEEHIFQIDLSLDNQKVLSILFEIYMDIEKSAQSESEKADPENPLPENAPISAMNISEQIRNLQEDMKNLAYNKVLSYIIQVVRKDPLYSPSFVHTRYDLMKLYTEVLEKRIRLIAKKSIKDNRIKKIEVYINKLFQDMQWVGIYTSSMADGLEQDGFIGFTLPYQIAVIYNFLEKYYKTLVKNTINILLLNGVFMEKNFQKLVSETFYNMDKFISRFDTFVEEVQADGPTGKKLTKELTKRNTSIVENRQAVEKIIVHINGQARDRFEEFAHLFSSMATIISRVFSDIESKPPKFIRNIRNIGSYQNSRFISSLQNAQNILQMMQSIMVSFSE